MKTLIIAGTAKMEGNNVRYNVTLYGQSPEMPLVQVITWFDMVLSGNVELETIAREKYCKYFSTDLNNIISLQNLNLIN